VHHADRLQRSSCACPDAGQALVDHQRRSCTSPSAGQALANRQRSAGQALAPSAPPARLPPPARPAVRVYNHLLDVMLQEIRQRKDSVEPNVQPAHVGCCLTTIGSTPRAGCSIKWLNGITAAAAGPARDWSVFLLNEMRDSGSESKSSRELTLYYGHTELVVPWLKYQLKKILSYR
jgi:hypothetical protein